MLKKLLLSIALASTYVASSSASDTVTLGLNYPETGPYEVQGLAQMRAAQMAVDEINAQGGILGKQVTLSTRDTKSQAPLSAENVADLIENDNAKMIFGGSSSGVAVASGLAAKERDTLYFGTLTYSNTVTGAKGHTHMFRECYNAWMAAKVLSDYLKENFAGKKYFYVTADYNWGWSTEESIRIFSGTEDENKFKRVLTPFPGAKDADFRKALTLAKANKPDVLVLVLFGNDMAKGLSIATSMGLKRDMEIVVPNLTLGMAESAGPKVMEGVVGALPWTWKVPELTGSEKGKAFVANFAEKHQSYPSTSAASAYSIVYQYKDAVERAGTFETAAVREALSGHSYSLLKDEQTWRDFDQQNVQTVYAVKGKPQAEVLKDKFKQDYFDIIASMPGDQAARTKEEWVQAREAAGAPDTLQYALNIE